jgi:hypothetical protein
MLTQRELSRRMRVRRAVREASGDLVYFASPRTLEMIGRFFLHNLPNPEQPRWKRVGYKRYEWKTPSAVLQIANSRSAWTVYCDGVPLVNAFDGRQVLFFARDEAENAAAAHACDGQDGHRQLADELCWEPDDELPSEPEDELSCEPEDGLCSEPKDEPCWEHELCGDPEDELCWEHDELCSEPEEGLCQEPELGV